MKSACCSSFEDAFLVTADLLTFLMSWPKINDFFFKLKGKFESLQWVVLYFVEEIKQRVALIFENTFPFQLHMMT